MIIGVDLGSTNIRVALYDINMELVDHESLPVSYIREKGGRGILMQISTVLT